MVDTVVDEADAHLGHGLSWPIASVRVFAAPHERVRKVRCEWAKDLRFGHAENAHGHFGAFCRGRHRGARDGNLDLARIRSARDAVRMVVEVHARADERNVLGQGALFAFEPRATGSHTRKPRTAFAVTIGRKDRIEGWSKRPIEVPRREVRHWNAQVAFSRNQVCLREHPKLARGDPQLGQLFRAIGLSVAVGVETWSGDHGHHGSRGLRLPGAFGVFERARGHGRADLHAKEVVDVRDDGRIERDAHVGTGFVEREARCVRVRARGRELARHGRGTRLASRKFGDA